jgi:hypothetical protein
MEWFRCYTRTLDSAKVQGLPLELFKGWFNLCCLARVHDGPLPPFKEIAFRLRVSESKAQNLVLSLESCNLIDRNEDGTFYMHDWNEHQRVSDDVAQRVAKHREKRRGNVTETPSEQREQKQSRADTETGAVAPTVRVRADRFAEFIAPWPRVAKPDQAARMWLSVIDTPADEDLAFLARDRYLASDEVARGVVGDPAKWLQDQKSAKWGGKWPAAVARAPNGKASTGDRVLAKMVQRIANGEKPL